MMDFMDKVQARMLDMLEVAHQNQKSINILERLDNSSNLLLESSMVAPMTEHLSRFMPRQEEEATLA